MDDGDGDHDASLEDDDGFVVGKGSSIGIDVGSKESTLSPPKILLFEAESLIVAFPFSFEAKTAPMVAIRPPKRRIANTPSEIASLWRFQKEVESLLLLLLMLLDPSFPCCFFSRSEPSSSSSSSSSSLPLT